MLSFFILYLWVCVYLLHRLTALKLDKVIYGLKQSPRCWYDELCSFLKTVNFKSSTADPCLFVGNNSRHPCYVHVHVEDMTIAGTSCKTYGHYTVHH